MKLSHRSTKEKGFTLVEVIVVLVILAILAAILIPTLTGYIDKANEKALIADCRQCVNAAQTIASEKYAKDGTVTADSLDKAEIKTLAEVSGEISAIEVTAKGAVNHLTYTRDGKSVTYCSAGGCSAGHTQKYNFDTNTNGIIGDTNFISLLLNRNKAVTSINTIDSTATEGNNENLMKMYSDPDFVKALQDGNIQSWGIHGNRTYLSDVDIADLPAGTWVKTIRYNAELKSFLPTYCKIEESNGYMVFSDNGFKKTIDGAYNFDPNDQASIDAAYAKALADFNKLEESTYAPGETPPYNYK